MKEIKDMNRLEQYFLEHKKYFLKKPLIIKLIEFEKGEIILDPLHTLTQFYIIAKGSVSIYSLTEDGGIRYLSKATKGTLLGDMEFSLVFNQSFYIEADENVVCLAIPFLENKNILENDPVFLKFVLRQLARKLSISSAMTAFAQTLEEKVLFFLRKVQVNHEIVSVNDAIQTLHCSRRQLQRVLKQLCDKGDIIKVGRGHYRLKE